MRLSLALLQYNIAWHDPEANFKRILELSESRSADLFILPEMFNTGFSMQPKLLSKKAQLQSLSFLQNLADIKAAGVLASMIWGDEENGFYNRLFFCQPGLKPQHYDKRHLFSFAQEDQHFKPGKEALVFDFRGLRINPLICYDLRFPIFARNNVDNPFDLQIYVANWPKARISAWDSLLTARAIENQCYVVGLNRVGEDAKGIAYNGHSKVIDAYGVETLSFKEGEEALRLISIEKEPLDEFRKKFPVLKDAD